MESKNRIILFSLIFVLGFLSCAFVVCSLSYLQIEKPLSFGDFGTISLVSGVDNSKLQAPSDWIKRDQIEVYGDKIVIKLPGASLSGYAPTGSMKPVLDKNSNGIRVAPESESQINVGDIVSFKQGEDLIVHRVVEKGEDENGTYFITKGDSNNINDGKIRFSDIKYVTVAIIW